MNAPDPVHAHAHSHSHPHSRGTGSAAPRLGASRALGRLAASLATALACSAIAAQTTPAESRADPWVPPHARQPDGRPSPSGAALQAAALDKLRRRFEAADLPGFGTLSRAQALRGGLGFVDAHFERIDATRSGHISFEELRRYLHSAR